MKASPTLSRKLGKLIPLLASDKDGEVLAAARKIIDLLASEGFDLHDLSAGLCVEGGVKATTAASVSTSPTFNDLTHFERRAWLDALLAVDWLTSFERDRVVDVRNIVLTGMDLHVHWRKKRTINELLARAAAMGVRA